MWMRSRSELSQVIPGFGDRGKLDGAFAKNFLDCRGSRTDRSKVNRRFRPMNRRMSTPAALGLPAFASPHSRVFFIAGGALAAGSSNRRGGDARLKMPRAEGAWSRAGASRDATAEPTRMDPARTSTRDLLASRGLACAGSRERRDGSAHAGPGERQTGARPSSSAPAPGTDRRGSAAPPSEPVEGGYAAAHAARLLQRERALRARTRRTPPRASPAPRGCFARPRR